jgi:sugar/nucleoside kinase (ribokinase family)
LRPENIFSIYKELFDEDLQLDYKINYDYVYVSAHKDKILEISTKKIEKIVDTTGAGDNFASGFLYYFMRNSDLEKCGEYGNFLAGKIIQKFGARFDSGEIENLK